MLLGKESAESLLSVRGSDVRDALPRIKKGIKAAIDFLKKEFGIEKLSNLPYPTTLIPLTAFFEGPEDEQIALTEKQANTLKVWFWKTCFSRRYSSATKRNLEADISGAQTLRKDGNSALGTFEVQMTENNFIRRRFIVGTVDTSAFILLLCSQKPRSLVNGGHVHISRVLTSGNRAEFHHLFPQAFLRAKEVDGILINSLANFCILSSSDNKRVGSRAPSVYKARLAGELGPILKSNVIPESLFNDHYIPFLDERAGMLVAVANTLMGKGP